MTRLTIILFLCSVASAWTLPRNTMPRNTLPVGTLPGPTSVEVVKASVPSPANAATGQRRSANRVTLSWTGSYGATYDVYLGLAADSMVLVSDGQAGRTYSAVCLAGVTHYWRVDSVGDETVTGDTWTFTTRVRTTLLRIVP